MNQYTLDIADDNALCQPLAARMRPQSLTTFYGQKHLLGEHKPLHAAIRAGLSHSMILWGPPGTGKTTLAQIIANSAKANFKSLSAVFAGVKEIREVVDFAKAQIEPTILFMDEIHRLNKSQQDAFLPFIENGTITLIGATTENPSFSLNNALLSRTRVYVLKSLTEEDLLCILQRALSDEICGLGTLNIDFAVSLQQQLVQFADGDARHLLNLLDLLVQLAATGQPIISITKDHLATLLAQPLARFDNQGDIFYDQISALHKSVRGSSPDAALYWFARMIAGGCDPLYIARRVVRMATEDIGNADPRALEISLNAWDTFLRLGQPEGELAIAQAIVYCAVAAKSNAVYTAYKQALEDAKQHGSLEVPHHLRNAPTKLASSLGHGQGYRYAHDEANAYAAGVSYFPDGFAAKTYYHPVDRGLESKIKAKLEFLKNLDARQNID